MILKYFSNISIQRLAKIWQWSGEIYPSNIYITERLIWRIIRMWKDIRIDWEFIAEYKQRNCEQIIYDFLTTDSFGQNRSLLSDTAFQPMYGIFYANIIGEQFSEGFRFDWRNAFEFRQNCIIFLAKNNFRNNIMQ